MASSGGIFDSLVDQSCHAYSPRYCEPVFKLYEWHLSLIQPLQACLVSCGLKHQEYCITNNLWV